MSKALDQHRTPLFSAMVKHAEANPTQFHIPGHKKGAGMASEFRRFVGDRVLALDLINIAPLDDLHHPRSIIKEAQQLAAAAFDADHTFFSVQGTSGAIMAMIMSVCGPGDKIIVPRNAHKSVLSAIIFSGAVPVFIHPVMDKQLGISHGITLSSVRASLEQHPDAKALVVINPTYYGTAANLREIVQLAHQHQIPVLVDEAHGVHIHFHDQLPLSAMQAGADMAATSMHKLGGSLTQSSILNLKEGLVSAKRVQTMLGMLTTTSTSYLLLSSLDVARKQLALHGKTLLDKTIRLANQAREAINTIPGLYCVGEELVGQNEAVHALDPTKLLIHVRQLGLTGHDVERWLREKKNIEVELSDLYNILCIITPGDTEQSVEALVQALQELARVARNKAERLTPLPVELPDIPRLAISPRDAFYAETELVPFDQSAGRIIAEFIMVYPPGIPILLPGEIITEENLAYILRNKEEGMPVQGPEDFDFRYLRVIKEYQAIR